MWPVHLNLLMTVFQPWWIQVPVSQDPWGSHLGLISLVRVGQWGGACRVFWGHFRSAVSPLRQALLFFQWMLGLGASRGAPVPGITTVPKEPETQGVPSPVLRSGPADLGQWLGLAHSSLEDAEAGRMWGWGSGFTQTRVCLTSHCQREHRGESQSPKNLNTRGKTKYVKVSRGSLGEVLRPFQIVSSPRRQPPRPRQPLAWVWTHWGAKILGWSQLTQQLIQTSSIPSLPTLKVDSVSLPPSTAPERFSTPLCDGSSCRSVFLEALPQPLQIFLHWLHLLKGPKDNSRH